MGRMLETLKLGESRRPNVAGVRVEPPAPVKDCVVEWEIGEEVPYVEVGGPNKKVELSPGLQQHPAQTIQPPHAPVEKALTEAATAEVTLVEAAPMAVAYEPWPDAAPAPTGIAAEIIAYHQPDHSTSKEYALLLDKMLASTKTTQASALLLVGSKPHVGTSTVLLNLAATASLRQKLRVIVVEANGTHADLAQRLGRVSYAGLPEVLDGTLALEQAIVKTALPSLHLLPGGAPIHRMNTMTAEAMAWLNTWLRERYDLILIDGPIIDDASDLSVHAPHANGIFLVLPHGESAAPKGIAQSIGRMGGRLCGLIHTRFE